jgi:hypothetical protein
MSAILQAAKTIILCWEALHPKLQNFGTTVALMVTRSGCALVCPGATKNDQPRHSLYAKGDTELIEWRIPQ